MVWATLAMNTLIPATILVLWYWTLLLKRPILVFRTSVMVSFTFLNIIVLRLSTASSLAVAVSFACIARILDAVGNRYAYCLRTSSAVHGAPLDELCCKVSLFSSNTCHASYGFLPRSSHSAAGADAARCESRCSTLRRAMQRTPRDGVECSP